jgi:hypothetical protein
MPYNTSGAALLHRIQGAGYRDEGTTMAKRKTKKRKTYLSRDEILAKLMRLK